MTDFKNTVDAFQPIVPGDGLFLPEQTPVEVANREKGLNEIDTFLNDEVAVDLQGVPTTEFTGRGLTGQPLEAGASEVDVLAPAIQEVLASDLAAGTKNQVIQEMRTQFERDGRVDAKAVNDLAIAESVKDVTRWQEHRNEAVNQGLKEGYDVAVALEEMNAEVEKLKSGGVLNTIQDFATAELFGWFMKPINGRQFMEKMFDVDGSFGDNISNAGLSNEAFFNWNQLSAEEQIRRAKAAPQIIKDIQAAGGDNDFDIAAMTQLMNGLTGNLEGHQELKTGLIFEPFVNIVTSGVVGGAGKTLFKGGKQLVSTSSVPKVSIAGMLSRVSPRAARKKLLEGVEDGSGATALQLGTTRAAMIADNVAPKSVDDAIIRGPDLNISDSLGAVDDLIDETLTLGVDETFFLRGGVTDAAKDAHAGLDKVMRAHAENGTVDLSKTVFGQNARGELTARYLIKNNDGLEFSSPREALDHVDTHFPDKRLHNVQLMRLKRDGSYEPVDRSANLDAQGGYYVQAEYVRDVSSSGTKDSLFREGVKPGITSNITDTAGAYNGDLAQALSRTSPKAAKIEQISTKVLQPFSKLSAKGQSKVDRVLREGEAEMKWYSDTELLKKMEGNRAHVEAYKAVRLHREWDMGLEEVALRRELIGRGYRYLPGNEGGLLIRKASEPVDEVWDSVKKEFRVADEAEEVYELLKPKLITRDNGEEIIVSHIARPKTGAVPTDIPAHFIGRTPGDLGRHINTRYRVIQKVKDSRGKVMDKTIRVANTPRAALRFIDNELDNPKNYEVSSLSDVNKLGPTDDRLAVLHDFNMLGNPSRPQLGWGTLDVTARKHLPSPADALARSQNRIADLEATRLLTDHMVNSLERQYGHVLENGKMNWDGKLRFAKGSLEDLPARKAAQTLQTKIKLVSGMDENMASGVLRDFASGQAEWFAKASVDLSRKSAGSKIDKAKASLLGFHSDRMYDVAMGRPLNFAKDSVQAAYIVYYPIRQMLLNAATSTMALGIQGGAKYTLSGGLARDLSFITLAKGAKDLNPELFDTIMKNYSKITPGVSPSDARKMFDDFDNSGLIQSVSSHQYLQHSGMNSSGLLPNSSRLADDAGMSGKITGSIKDAARATRYVGQKGFSIGETVNLTTSYLVMRNRALLKAGSKKGLTRAEHDKVLSDAKQFTGNMDQTNKSLLQSGNLGLAFQFMSHTTKMMQLILPTSKMTKRWASPVLSNREKLQVMGVYGAMWGAGGYTLANQTLTTLEEDLGFDLTPIERELVVEGLVGMGLEYAWEGMTGEELNVNISEQIGALGGTTADFKIAAGIVSGDKAMASERPGTALGSIFSIIGKVTGRSSGELSEHLGPAVSFAGSLTKAGAEVVETFNNPVLSTGETLQYQIHTMLRALPAYNSAYQGRIMMNTGKVLSQRGDFKAEGTWSEGLLTALTGVRNQETRAVYDLQAELLGSSLGREAASAREIETSAKETAGQIISLVTWKNEGKLDRHEAVAALGAHLSQMKIAYPDQVQFDMAKQITFDTLIERLDNQDNDSTFDDLIHIIVEDKELHKELGYARFKRMLKELPDSQRKDRMLSQMDLYFKGSFEQSGNQ